MITKDYQHFAVLFHTNKGKQNISKDLTLEIYEDTDVATKILQEYFFSCRAFFQTTAHITHLDYPGVSGVVKGLISFLRNSEHQKIVDLMREWIASDSPEQHIAISGFVYTCLRKALLPKKLLYCLVPERKSSVSSVKKLTKVEIVDGWVSEILSEDSCPLLGCVPLGDGYVSWRLYPESTFVPVLGLVDFCRHQKVLPLVEKWTHKYSEMPESKIFKAIHQIENIEITRDSLFV